MTWFKKTDDILKKYFRSLVGKQKHWIGISPIIFSLKFKAVIFVFFFVLHLRMNILLKDLIEVLLLRRKNVQVFAMFQEIYVL